ncbi:uncharacterized protein LOC5510464 [Nematostella vectensis]|uniref:uncharacterized protein LOC5510464 n=1 Tax=Nematostella vectensis TaxID=45351 RepID=UPI002077514C|nr:uncharacterized protein LOC5510464 [Nematostella vectensis]
MAADVDAKGHSDKAKPCFLYQVVAVFRDKWNTVLTRVSTILTKIYVMLAPLLNFLIAIYTSIVWVFTTLRNSWNTLVRAIRAVIYFDYKAFFVVYLRKPIEYYDFFKAELHQRLRVPVENQISELKNQVNIQLREIRIYARGFCELCRRLFLLLCDLVPGGRVTVTASLVVLALLTAYHLYYYSKLVLQLLDILMSIVWFVMSPVILTLKDLWSVVYKILAVLGTLLVNFMSIILRFLTAGIGYLLRIVGTLLSFLIRSIMWFLELKYVQLVWRSVLRSTVKFLELLVVVVIPFVTLLLVDVSAFLANVSLYFYDKFASVSVLETHSIADPLSNSRVCAMCLTLYCVLWAYRWRNKFPNAYCNDLDAYDNGRQMHYVKSHKTGGYTRDAGKEGNREGINIKFNSQAHICAAFIKGDCTHGHHCDNHHCPLAYHWQFRAPLEGWKSLSAHDNDILEKLYCDVSNDVVTTSDISPDLSSSVSFMRHRQSSSSDESHVRIEFEDMRIEINRYRTDIRRLSTPSYAKKKGAEPLSTRWVWYRAGAKDGCWEKYGQDVGVKQERLESAFCRRESSYNFKSPEGDTIRIYFCMKPMYERNMSPRQSGQRRTVRRRPEYRPSF